ncbi:hypothetical protein EDC14_1005121 [Hydrogenispora ethanolica]|uniref:Membrane protein YqhR n=1 Tax=Hydrogenispora ethanolica TaxID=1082276 RepID=A0A4R1S2K9_HYDET|nr:hypothetical protein [Hydrogenispora ethanolica]TCL73259.1 hypothetical protein EDC14_1005121 [Hydrogenispora ethanolica]
MDHFEKEQEFIKGATAGIIGSTVMFLCTETLHWLGLTRYSFAYLSGETVFTYHNTLPSNLLAFFITILAGAFWGVIIAFLFTKFLTGRHYGWKIIFISSCIFFFHLGFLDEPFHYSREIHRRTFDLFVILLGYNLYGWVVARVLKRLAIIRE